MAAAGSPTDPDGDAYVERDQGHGHLFVKKTFHKPTYCHHCAEMLWGLIGQGYVCEDCNFVVHDRCLKTVCAPCVSIIASLIKNPIAHCWSEPGHFKKKFCNVCRKRLEDTTMAMHCVVCEYFVHMDCFEISVPDCRECATYIPKLELPDVVNFHHWREGNLPANSKCAVCKKSCWSSECLTGMRCEWCGYTTHSACMKSMPAQCTFSNLESIMIPPSCVSTPRTEVPMETIIGVQTHRKEAQVISEEFSSSGDLKTKEGDELPTSSKDKEKEKDDETIKVYDGNTSFRRRLSRIIIVPKNANRQRILDAAIRILHIVDDSSLYYVTDAHDSDEPELDQATPLQDITRPEGKRPAIFLRFRQDASPKGFIKVYPGKMRHKESFKAIPVVTETTVADVIEEAVKRFDLEDSDPENYRLIETSVTKEVTERIMENEENPWDNLKRIGKESLRYMQNARFYLQQKEDPHGSIVALFVGNLPPNLSQRQYEKVLVDFVGLDNKFSSIGPIYYEYGSMILTYDSSESAVKAFYTLNECSYEDKSIMVLLLPTIQPHLLPEGVLPLLVFVNAKSGGCQGLELIASFRKLLNPYQVFDLENGGPLPGLYVFRHIKYYKILVCGGDGTIGWVLQCLDNVGQDSECQSPACAIVPLGTGNDLARVLRWGAGYQGGEDPLNLLKDVIEADEIRLDRWTVVFHPEEKTETKEQGPQVMGQLATSEENTQIFVMNNYFGIGIDADLCLDFHNAREENPNKFNSRLHNKGVYVKMGLRKMMSRKMCKDLHKEMRLEVDGKVVDLPAVEGIIILNILSWGSGANPWGPEKDDHFSKPNHYDGMLEVVGVSGVVHLGQIQSGLRSATRIAQGGHIKIRLHSDMPVQVDGEPWVQSPGEVVVLKSALKATMLKKTKGKIKRRNTEPSMVVVGVGRGGPVSASAAGAGCSASGDSKGASKAVNTSSGPF